MFSGHTIGLHGRTESDEQLLEDPVSEVGNEEETSGKVLFAASFEEFSKNHVHYDTVIWVLISLLLVLAWGVGLIMLLYLPVRRYVLQKDISSRRLYVTSNEIVYKATRPSFLPLLGLIKVEKRIPLHLVIEIVIEQGCLQSIYGIHTFRIESTAYGKAAPVDELQFQGVSNPMLLRKVIIIEATKNIQHVGNLKPHDEVSTPSMRSHHDIPHLSKWQSPSMKLKTSSRRAFSEAGVPVEILLHKLDEVKESVQLKTSSRRAFSEAGVPVEILLHKLDEVKESVQKLESVIVGSNLNLQGGF